MIQTQRNASPRSHLRPLPTLPMTPVAVNRTEVPPKGDSSSGMNEDKMTQFLYHQAWNPYATMNQRPSPEKASGTQRPKSTVEVSTHIQSEVDERLQPPPAVTTSSAPTVPTRDAPFTPPPHSPTVSSSPALLESPVVHKRRSFQAIIKTGIDKVMKKDTPDPEQDSLLGLRYESTNPVTRPSQPIVSPYATGTAAPSGNWSDAELVSSPLERNPPTHPDLTPFASTSRAAVGNSGLVVSVPVAPVVGSAPAVGSAPGLRSTNSYTSPKHTHHRHSSSTDIFSVAHSGVEGLTLNVSIADLCKHIRHSSSGGHASKVMEINWYKEQGGVKHEFLIVKVVGDPNPHTPSPERHTSSSSTTSNPESVEDRDRAPHPRPPEPRSQDGHTTWLRLDRAARKGYGGFFQLKSSSAIFPANDTVGVLENLTWIEIYPDLQISNS